MVSVGPWSSSSSQPTPDAHLVVVLKSKESIPSLAAEVGALVDRHIVSPGHCRRQGAGVGGLRVATARDVVGENRHFGVRGAGVHIEPISGTAALARVSRAGEGAVGQGGFDAAVVDGVSAVALPPVLGAEVLEPNAGVCALLHGHQIVKVGGSRQSPHVGGFCVAPREAVARDLGGRAACEGQRRGAGADPGEGGRSGNECK